jgi:hypothetical protein
VDGPSATKDRRNLSQRATAFSSILSYLSTMRK